MQVNDSFERVELERPDSPPLDKSTVTPRLQEDEIVYDDLAPCPPSGDVTGSTLLRTNLMGWESGASSWPSGQPAPRTN